MADAARDKAVSAALVPIVASLGSWGVEEAHWLPDRQGAPVIWLRVRKKAQAEALRKQVWLLPQLQVTLTRFGIAHDVVWNLRIELSSAEAEAELFRE